MKKIVITGFSISTATSLAGIQRVCRELLLRLDALLPEDGPQVEYVYPENAPHTVVRTEEFRHIRPVPVKKPRFMRGPLGTVWRNRFLNRYTKKENAVGCCLSLEMPFGTQNISFIYDLRPAAAQFDPAKFRKKFGRYLQKCKKRCTLALTDSLFQKRLIAASFGWSETKIETVYLGWEHVKEIAPDEGIFEKFPALGNGGYFYTLGSLAPHKNFKWMMEVAKRNPDKLFVIAGGKDLKIWKDNVEDDTFPNVLFPGRVTDGENRALMERCRAFLFPSKFEGFGIPPLEALACGAAVACSSATCLPEIYEDCVHYFDPDDYNVDLDGLLAQPVAPPDKLLAKYSWDKAAEKLLSVLKSEAEK